MIPGPHRLKGGAPLLGVTVVGRRGPFGVRSEEEEPDHEQHAEPESDANQPGTWADDTHRARLAAGPTDDAKYR